MIPLDMVNFMLDNDSLVALEFGSDASHHFYRSNTVIPRMSNYIQLWDVAARPIGNPSISQGRIWTEWATILGIVHNPFRA